MFTKTEVLEALDEILQNSSGTVNPVDDNGTCVYTGEDGSHCIAGQILTNLGILVPEWGTPENIKSVRELGYLDTFFDKNALDYLEGLQFYADMGRSPWALAKSKMDGFKE